ncbi:MULTISPECIES: tyrosine--tRNA ligase [Micromonospora]|uniref:tyrosine--tRNA ligase n=1 Tax=Micromonospora TaxID=1873 RepID=UPI0003EECE61|nr:MULTISPECIES: tyrosine--tRNA ligase [Micromonospora]EWM64374.1 tyrosine--tRNA ligase [Micromonospora sp. M42]MCK1806584.1 tyrosine--tRNA ligase [Micromonospora sp. R42106]MCK1832527.1 tyrosine--tRNA ligase [Micromonospora sp. R42003]MCK1847392.1 tyrosine--tRNA ligase [Micromonospora sp. R42004]MCM1018386.1 tyrosine--tRNA ligase [Micromonospora sp. XM-20-01]
MTDSNLPQGRDSLTDDLLWRGLIQDSTGLDELRDLLGAGQATFYVGFDPTAPSLHVGHLMQVLTARRLQLAGHRPLLLVGGATGQIGDPKESAERTLNSPEVVAGWVERIREQLSPFVTYTGENAAQLVNNLDWTGEMSVVEFLRDVGKHFPVNKMLAREVVRARLETGISFTEFSYQLLQANDFFELHRRHGCQLQYGGSDQWGNITAGVDYVRRRGAGPVQAFTTPLVTKSDGTKFGKSESGAIWLDPQMTSPYAFYQFWVNADDRDVSRYLRYFSFRSREELEELEKATAERPQARLAQRALAEELTTLVHGERETAQAVAASQALFGRGSLDELAPETLRAALTEAGLVRLDELPDVAGLLKESGLVPSMKEARRVIAEGGAYVNNTRISEVDATVSADDLLHGRYLVLRRGKRSFAGVELRG